MNKTMKHFFLTLGLALCSFLLVPKIAEASSISLGIYPPIIQVDTTPPASISAPLEIHNLGDDSVQLKIILKPFKASDSENGQLTYLKDNESFGDDPLFLQRVKIFDDQDLIDSLDLAPKQVKKLTLNIEIPSDEPPSDYYFSVIFVSKTQLETDLNASQNAGGIGTNVLVSIGPKGTTKGAVKEFSAPFWLENGPVPFTVRIANESKHFINPKGEIMIKNMFGQTIGRVDLLPVNILSGTVRAIPSAAGGKKPIIDSQAALWPEELLIGPYAATLTLSLSEQGPILKKTIHFIGFPIQIILGVIVVAVILLLIRNKVRKQLLE